jgi:S-adenosylmethionine hydrolase
MPTNPPALITLTTDFGYSDGYVGAVKGVMLRLLPGAQIIDIHHGVAAHDVLDGAFTIAQVYAWYPADTIHVVVVDPGVGSARRPILVRAADQFFIAPDNGVLSLIYDRHPEAVVRHVTATHYFLSDLSSTFHARDVFAPIAAWLGKGVAPDNFGNAITDFVRFGLPKPKPNAGGVAGVVLKVDRFGNLITNLTRADLPGYAGVTADQMPIRLRIGKATVESLVRAYAFAPAQKLVALWGSVGYLEIAANRASAARLAGAERGAEVVVETSAEAGA